MSQREGELDLFLSSTAFVMMVGQYLDLIKLTVLPFFRALIPPAKPI